MTRSSYPKGGFPCWIEGDEKMNETNALMRYLAKKYGYFPEDPKLAWDVDATFDYIYNEHFGKNKKPEFVKVLVEKMSAKLEKSGTKFLCADTITTPDFLMTGLAYGSWREFGKPGKLKSKAIGIVEGNAVFRQYLDNLEEEMKGYLSTRKTYPINPSHLSKYP